MHWKRAGVLVLLIASLLALYGSALAGELWYTRDNTHLRDAATTGGKSLMIVRGGQPVEVVGTSGEWYRVKYGGTTGYIRSDMLVQLSRAGYLPLELGNECPQVEALQERLKDLGYFAGRCDGEFGEDTRDAVIAFQKRNKITADGVAGGETQELLYSSKAKSSSGGAASSSGANYSGTESGSTSSSSSSVLKKGDSGSAVTQLQQRLKQLGYIAFSADGVFGTGTENAVIAFQKNNGLTADGIAGAATLTKLNSSSAKAASSSGSSDSTVLKLGDTGSAVRSIQQQLKDLGYITFTPDGIFGSGTERGIRYFQDRNGLKVDGIVGASTLNLLGSNAAIPSATSSSSAAVTELTVLKRGDTGSAVSALQQRLKALGYLSAVDGAFGSATRNAVIAFQKNNGLTADGIAGASTLTALNSSSAKAASASSGSSSSGGTSGGPSASSVKLLHFFNDVKPKYKSGTVVTIYDPDSGYSWKLRFMSMGRHADSEPLTAEDTAVMNKAFGNITTWTPKAVWVKFPDGVWSMATMHNTPHLSKTIKDNNFDGHLCVHFLRDMAECKANDPQYGVQNQTALRAAWKGLTGQTVD